MFDEYYTSYRNIISSIAIHGYEESAIISRGINTKTPLELTCLYSYPYSEEDEYNQPIYDMMFPDKDYNIECPKFFSLFLTDDKGNRSYLYCLKFPEKYIIEKDNRQYEITVPLIICIKSNKGDLEPFRQLLTSINQIIVGDNIDYDSRIVNDYKKVELLNIFYFIFSLPHTPPHSLVRLKLNNDLCEVEKEIDFYFSSNCEIPCNKNDTDINLLFLILDQSIIVKVIIAILSEKQIIFRASQAYILHMIIPAFLKLIFPFKWQQKITTIIPNQDTDDILETPGSYIFGILSNALSLQKLLDRYPGKIIVDCDTNEIFGEEENNPYIPEKIIEGKEEISLFVSFRKKKEKTFNNLDGGIKQGKNIFIVDGSYIYQYEPDNNGEKKKVKFLEKNNIIIDTQKSQLLMHKNSDFISSSEIKWLRRNIQLIRNPEIFEIENIKIKYNKDNNKNKPFNENDSLILPNRSFSYNIQNILMQFYLIKISNTDSTFMDYFKNTDLYSSYINIKKYQNDSGKKIIDNIKETVNNPKSIENCFIVEFNKKIFSALTLLDDIDKEIIKLTSDNSNQKNPLMNIDILNQIRTILRNYCLVLGIYNNNINININNNNINNIQNKNNLDLNLTNEKSSEFSLNSINTISTNKIKNKINKNQTRRTHIKSNSLLQFSINQNTNFNLAGFDKDSKDHLKFYQKDGFINFAKNMGNLKTREGHKLGDIPKLEIFKELFNKYKSFDKIFKEQKEAQENEIIIDVLNDNFEDEEIADNDENEIINKNEIKMNNNNKLNLNIINKSTGKKKLIEELKGSTNTINDNKKLFKIEENNEENNNDSSSFIDKSIKVSDNKENDYLANIILGSFKSEENNQIEESKSESIICFLSNDSKNSNESENFINFEEITQKKTNKQNHNLTQYYLFLAFYLEEISHFDELLEKFNKEILKFNGFNINIYKLIIKLYKEAYKYSGEKHRDFPYFTFFSFLQGLNDKNLAKLEKNLSEDDYNISELFEIYESIMRKRKIKMIKDQKIISEIEAKRARTINNLKYDSLNDNMNEIKEDRKTQKNPELNFSRTLNNQIVENIFTEENIINEDFRPLIEPNSFYILNTFCTLMLRCFPSEKDIKVKTAQQIIDEVNVHMNSETLKELLGELKIIELNKLKTQFDKLCFWLNSFNFLLLFAVFYLKAYAIGKNFWENFFKNIKFNIGGNKFSFEDMLYILFKKNIFFPKNKYSPKEYVKKQVVDLTKEKNISQELIFISPLLLYIPTKEFFMPIIYDSNDLQSIIMARISNIMLFLLNWNEEIKTLYLNGILSLPELNFANKGYTKYKPYIKENIYQILKGKKYKKLSLRQMNWELSFDNLLNYINIEE